MKILDLDKLIDALTGYIETKIELLQLDLKEELTSVMAQVVAVGAIVVSSLVAFLFLFLGLAALLNQLLESSFLGYFIIAILWLALAALFAIRRTSIVEKVKKRVSSEEVEEKEKTEV